MKKLMIKILIFVFLFTGGFRINPVNAAAIELVDTPLFSDANLVAYYQLEDATDSKNSYDLINNNSVTFTSAKFNNGGLGASTKSLNVASTLGFTATSNSSYLFWVKLGTEISINFYQFLVHYIGTNTPLNMIRYDYNSGNRRINFYSGNYSASYQHTLTMGTTNWYHFAMTRVGATGVVKCYVNGEYVGGFTDAGTGTNSANFQLLGQGTVNNVIGLMDDVAVFDRVLDPTEITNLYNGTFPATDTCTYGGSGDWDVLATDNCYITSDVYVVGKLNLIGSSTVQGILDCAPDVKISAESYNFGPGLTPLDADCFAHH